MLIENTDYREEFLDLGNPFDVKIVNKFLEELDFHFNPQSVEETIVLYNLNNEIIGTGSLKKNVLKYNRESYVSLQNCICFYQAQKCYCV